MNETFICSRCGAEHLIDGSITFSAYRLCRSCYDTETCACDHCGDRIWAADSCGDEHHTLCQDCANCYYDRCADCGRFVLTEDLQYLEDGDDDGYCSSCFDRHLQESGVHSYCYKPEPVFYGGGPRYFGVELEIDEGGENRENAHRLQAIANEFTENIYIKHDGSLDKGAWE